MKKSKILVVMLAAMLVFCTGALAACVAPGSSTTFTVKFDLNYDGAPSMEDMVVPAGSYIEEPEVEREGYVVDYWRVQGASAKFNFALMPIMSDITLVAYWKEEIPEDTEFTLTFYYNDGTRTDPYLTQNVLSGEKPTAISNPTRSDGYTFRAWYEDAECTIPFSFNTEVTASKSLYAGWDAAQTSLEGIYLKHTASSAEAIKLTLSDGKYTASDVSLAKNQEVSVFKRLTNGIETFDYAVAIPAINEAQPAGAGRIVNNAFVTDIADKYTISFKFSDDALSEFNIKRADWDKLIINDGEQISTSPSGYYIQGNFTGWNVYESHKMEAVNGHAGYYSYDFTTQKAGDIFKFVFHGGESVVWIPDGYGTEITLAAANIGETIYLNVTDPDNPTWSFYAPGEEPVLENGFYLVGDFNNWLPEANYIFTKVEGEDYYSFDIGALGLTDENYFKLFQIPDGGNGWRGNFETEDITKDHNGNAQYNNFTTIYVTTDGRIFVDEIPSGEPPAVLSAGFYLYGGFDGWQKTEANKLAPYEDNGNYYYLDLARVGASGEGEGNKFLIIEIGADGNVLHYYKDGGMDNEGSDFIYDPAWLFVYIHKGTKEITFTAPAPETQLADGVYFLIQAGGNPYNILATDSGDECIASLDFAAYVAGITAPDDKFILIKPFEVQNKGIMWYEVNVSNLLLQPSTMTAEMTAAGDIKLFYKNYTDLWFCLQPSLNNKLIISRAGWLANVPANDSTPAAGEYYLVGNFNNWKFMAAQKLSYNDTDNYYYGDFPAGTLVGDQFQLYCYVDGGDGDIWIGSDNAAADYNLVYESTMGTTVYVHNDTVYFSLAEIPQTPTIPSSISVAIGTDGANGVDYTLTKSQYDSPEGYTQYTAVITTLGQGNFWAKPFVGDNWFNASYPNVTLTRQPGTASFDTTDNAYNTLFTLTAASVTFYIKIDYSDIANPVLKEIVIKDTGWGENSIGSGAIITNGADVGATPYSGYFLVSNLTGFAVYSGMVLSSFVTGYNNEVYQFDLNAVSKYDEFEIFKVSVVDGKFVVECYSNKLVLTESAASLSLYYDVRNPQNQTLSTDAPEAVEVLEDGTYFMIAIGSNAENILATKNSVAAEGENPAYDYYTLSIDFSSKLSAGEEKETAIKILPFRVVDGVSDYTIFNDTFSVILQPSTMIYTFGGMGGRDVILTFGDYEQLNLIFNESKSELVIQRPNWIGDTTGLTAATADGYYLTGNFADWKAFTEYELIGNAEYISKEIDSQIVKAGDEFKIIKIASGEQTYLGDGDNAFIYDNQTDIVLKLEDDSITFDASIINAEMSLHIYSPQGEGTEDDIAEDKTFTANGNQYTYVGDFFKGEYTLAVFKGNTWYTPSKVLRQPVDTISFSAADVMFTLAEDTSLTIIANFVDGVLVEFIVKNTGWDTSTQTGDLVDLEGTPVEGFYYVANFTGWQLYKDNILSTPLNDGLSFDLTSIKKGDVIYIVEVKLNASTSKYEAIPVEGDAFVADKDYDEITLLYKDGELDKYTAPAPVHEDGEFLYFIGGGELTLADVETEDESVVYSGTIDLRTIVTEGDEVQFVYVSVVDGVETYNNPTTVTLQPTTAFSVTRTGTDNKDVLLTFDIYTTVTFIYVVATDELVIQRDNWIGDTTGLTAATDEGAYVVGNFNNWKAFTDFAFVALEGYEDYYSFTLTGLTEGDEYKLFAIDSEGGQVWYGSKGNGNIYIQGAHEKLAPFVFTDEVTVYRYPDGGFSFAHPDHAGDPEKVYGPAYIAGGFSMDGGNWILNDENYKFMPLAGFAGYYFATIPASVTSGTAYKVVVHSLGGGVIYHGDKPLDNYIHKGEGDDFVTAGEEITIYRYPDGGFSFTAPTAA